jgi:hypothetical protein
MARGRPTEYTDEHSAAAKDYIENYKNYDQVIPSAVGMAVVMGIARSTLYKWASEGKGDISDTLSMCNDHQHTVALNNGLTSVFNPTIAKLVLANHGYHEKSEQKLTGTIETHELTGDELDRRLQELELEEQRSRED